MKDNKDIILGDLVIVRYNEVVRYVTLKVLFKEFNDDGDLICYPLDKRGEDLARYQNGEYDNGEDGLFSKEEFLITNTDLDDLQEISPGALNKQEKVHYDVIFPIITA